MGAQSECCCNGGSNTVTEKQKDAIAARLGANSGNTRNQDADLQRALEQMVGAGADRFGMRAEERGVNGADACALAPPLARLIDHTALKPEMDEKQVRELCREAREHCFASVCVSPVWVPIAYEELRGSTPAVCTVIGFPSGAFRSRVKAFETAQAIKDGADEIDMVLAIGVLKSGRYDDVENDIKAVVDSARDASGGRAIVKVILETALLTDEEKVIACVLSQNAGANFVKTSTGFAKGGATPADVALMRRVVGSRLGVKASGGIRSLEDAEQMVAHGATRLGASAGVEIMQGLSSDSDY